MAWLGLAWFGLAWFGLIWLGLAWFELPEATKYQDCKKVSRTLSSLLLSWSIFRLLLLLPAPYPCAPLQFSGFHEGFFFLLSWQICVPWPGWQKKKNSGRRRFFFFCYPGLRPGLSLPIYLLTARPLVRTPRSRQIPQNKDSKKKKLWRP